MVKSPIRPSAKKVNTSEKQKRIGERSVLLHSSGKYSMHHSGFLVAVLQDFRTRWGVWAVAGTFIGADEEW